MYQTRYELELIKCLSRETITDVAIWSREQNQGSIATHYASQDDERLW
jgi:hypothetical protein